MSSKSEFWTAHIVGWRGSGLSQAAYCRQHGLELKRICYWRRRLGQTLTSSPAVLPIVVSERAESDNRLEVCLPNGLQVRVSMSANPARLAPLIRLLRSC